MKEPRKRYNKTSDTLKERLKLKHLYKDKLWSAERIAQKLNWSERTVWNRLAFHGLTADHKAPEYCTSCGHVIYN